MAPVTNIYLIGLFELMRTPKTFLQQLYFIIVFNTWSNVNQIESTVKASINTAVFRTGYLENERGDPSIFFSFLT